MSNLFENIPSSSSEDYVALVEQPQKASLRDIAQNLWENFEPYADSDFRSDFSVHIHQRFWEMYLGAWFLRNGYQLIKRNSKAGPDIQICHKGQTIWIEASAPCEGQGQDAVPPITESRPFKPIPEDKIILRFTGAVSSITFSRENYISQGFVSSFDPYVIAINCR